MIAVEKTPVDDESEELARELSRADLAGLHLSAADRDVYYQRESFGEEVD